jgi:hypothetical protein
MPYGNIDAQVSPADVQAIKDAVATIRTKLPFLISLTVQDRKRTFKLGPDSLSFVQNSLQAAKDNPSVVPSNFSTTFFENDANLFSVLTEVNTVVAQLASDVNDTRLAIGGEAMKEAGQIYTYVKAAAASTPGLKPVVQQLGERFQKASKTPPTPPPA